MKRLFSHILQAASVIKLHAKCVVTINGGISNSGDFNKILKTIQMDEHVCNVNASQSSNNVSVGISCIILECKDLDVMFFLSLIQTERVRGKR